MTDAMDMDARLGAGAGTWRRLDSGWELHFERRLRHSPERVWKALTTVEGRVYRALRKLRERL